MCMLPNLPRITNVLLVDSMLLDGTSCLDAKSVRISPPSQRLGTVVAMLNATVVPALARLFDLRVGKISISRATENEYYLK